MTERPLSDRRPHESGPVPWEVRAWTEPAGHLPEERGWRTLGWSAEHDDAVLLAGALVSGPDPAFQFAEVWGPAADDGPGHHHSVERFPEPGREERRDMWLRAAAAHYGDAIDYPRSEKV